MSLTSAITLSFLIKAWILGIAIYLIRTTSAQFEVKTRTELLLYIIAGVAVLWSGPIFGLALGSGKEFEMNRQESDLVKDYLKHRQKGETLGDYLMRVETEEEQEISRQRDEDRPRRRKKRVRD